MKKIFELSLILVMTMGVFSCGSKSDEVKNPKPPAQSETEPEGKKVITIGTPAYNAMEMPIINKFNSSQNEYVVELKNYAELIDSDYDSDEALNIMRMEIANGTAPDIIMCHPEFMADFIRQNTFADLCQLMDSHDGVKREDFLPNVLEGFEIDGKIPAISSTFFIRTADAKVKNVGINKENWTPEEAIEVYNLKSEESSFLNSTGDYFADFFLKKAGRNCIDLKNYTCDFNNEDFKNTLNYVKTSPQTIEDEGIDEMSDDELNAFFRDKESELMFDRAIINEFTIAGINDTLTNNICTQFGGEETVMVGYPSYDGKGYITSCDFMYAINEDSPNKEAAWKFITFLLDKDILRDTNLHNGGIPVIQSVLDEAAFEFDENVKGSIKSCHILPDGSENFDISDETVQKIYDYIVGVEFDPYLNYILSNMITEECHAVLVGDKTVEECADILQSRISIYLGERK